MKKKPSTRRLKAIQRILAGQGYQDTPRGQSVALPPFKRCLRASVREDVFCPA